MLSSWQPAKRPIGGVSLVQPNGSSQEAILAVSLSSRRPEVFHLDTYRTSSLYIVRYFLQWTLCPLVQFTLGGVCTISLFELFTDHQKGKWKEVKAICISNEIAKNKNASPRSWVQEALGMGSRGYRGLLSHRLPKDGLSTHYLPLFSTVSHLAVRLSFFKTCLCWGAWVA